MKLVPLAVDDHVEARVLPGRERAQRRVERRRGCRARASSRSRSGWRRSRSRSSRCPRSACRRPARRRRGATRPRRPAATASTGSLGISSTRAKSLPRPAGTIASAPVALAQRARERADDAVAAHARPTTSPRPAISPCKPLRVLAAVAIARRGSRRPGACSSASTGGQRRQRLAPGGRRVDDSASRRLTRSSFLPAGRRAARRTRRARAPLSSSPSSSGSMRARAITSSPTSRSACGSSGSSGSQHEQHVLAHVVPALVGQPLRCHEQLPGTRRASAARTRRAGTRRGARRPQNRKLSPEKATRSMTRLDRRGAASAIGSARVEVAHQEVEERLRVGLAARRRDARLEQARVLERSCRCG